MCEGSTALALGVPTKIVRFDDAAPGSIVPQSLGRLVEVGAERNYRPHTRLLAVLGVYSDVTALASLAQTDVSLGSQL